jgi:hypothetical protein
MLMTHETPWLPAVDATATDESKDASESNLANVPDAVPTAGGTRPRERRPSGAV